MLKEKLSRSAESLRDHCKKEMRVPWQRWLLAGICGFSLTLGLCFLFSWLMCTGMLNADMVGFFAYTALFAGGVLAAWLAAGHGDKKLMTALPACGVVWLLLALCGLLFFGGFRLGPAVCAMLILLLSGICGSAVSALRR